MRKLGRLAVAVVLSGLGMAVVTAAVVVGVRAVAEPGWKSADTSVDLQPLATRSVVYARDGSVLALLHAEENRSPVPLDRMPGHVVQAVLDAEDDRFFEHGAIDLRALGRALAVNVEQGGVYEGGSTITQQLVKVSLLNSRQDLQRKFQEVSLAVRLEAKLSKNQILERYLNTVYFGNGAYGLQAAAERYFNTDVDKLTMGQGILLASLIRNPVRADPFVDADNAIARRDVVIDRMRDLEHLTPAEADQIKAEPLPTPPPERPASGSDYFTEEVKQQLLDDPRLGGTPQERNAAVFRGGLAIHTTLDPGYQRMAEAAVATKMPDTKGQFNAALSSVDPTTGAVRALVGGPDFARKKFNLATQKGRPTGSAFKVFTLIAALEKGFSPFDSISGSSPCPIPNPGGPPWAPVNVEGSAGGTLSLVDATAQSVNCAYARLVTQVGPERVVDVAHRMGITNDLKPYPSITLGVDDVSPLQMASAYATLAADGERHKPYFVERVADRNGNVLFAAETKGERVISSDLARTVNGVLTQVVQRGTARAAGLPGWTVAGKTGTSEENKNAWFVGYTPTLSTAVWMGNPDAEVSMYNVGGIRVYGGTYPARIWNAYMSGVVQGVAPVGFPPPQNPIGGAQFRAAPGAEPAPNRAAPVPGRAPGGGARPEREVVVVPEQTSPTILVTPDGEIISGGPVVRQNPVDRNPYVRTRPHRPRDE